MFTSNANTGAQAGNIYLNGDILNDGASGSLQAYELSATAGSEGASRNNYLFQVIFFLKQYIYAH